jgi:hypothetical protein
MEVAKLHGTHVGWNERRSQLNDRRRMLNQVSTCSA